MITTLLSTHPAQVAIQKIQGSILIPLIILGSTLISSGVLFTLTVRGPVFNCSGVGSFVVFNSLGVHAMLYVWLYFCCGAGAVADAVDFNF